MANEPRRPLAYGLARRHYPRNRGALCGGRGMSPLIAASERRGQDRRIHSDRDCPHLKAATRVREISAERAAPYTKCRQCDGMPVAHGSLAPMLCAAVRALYHAGWTHGEIAFALELHDETVTRHLDGECGHGSHDVPPAER